MELVEGEELTPTARPAAARPDRVVITKHGRPAAVVVSIDDLESLEETLDVMGKPRLLEQIRDSLADLERGEAETLTKDEALALVRP
jgi:PHD/YefM family antitoxin component YafN of YafNO toxin-antitoxin module